ncbi:MAG: hypothetical protein HY074_16300 [Deltaproteobacteria bacterium]|nr:hypothetical protein [Deltaproteobacteria bacterium]
MNSKLFIVLGMMVVPAIASAHSKESGLSLTKQNMGECTEDRPGSEHGFELLNYKPLPPLRTMKLSSVEESDTNKAFMSAKMTSGGKDYILVSNPPQTQGFDTKEIWSKLFEAKADGDFASKDGARIVLRKKEKSYGEIIDPGFSFDPGSAGFGTYEASVIYSDGGLPVLVKMTCKINEVQLAKVDGSLERKFKILGKHQDKIKSWKIASDAVQCKDTPTSSTSTKPADEAGNEGQTKI